MIFFIQLTDELGGGHPEFWDGGRMDGSHPRQVKGENVVDTISIFLHYTEQSSVCRIF